jgi:ABC-type sugar transport system substrate-binding protein
VAERPLSRRGLLRAGAGLVLAPGLLAACGGGDGAPPPRRTRKVGLSLAGSYPFARCVATGAYAALQGSGYELVVRQAEFSSARESQNIAAFIADRVAGLVIQPVAVESATRGAQFAQQAGVKVAACMSPGPGPGSKFFAGVAEVPSTVGGRLIGAWLKANVPGGGGLIVVQGLLGQGISEGLDLGLDEGLATAGGRFEIVARGPGNLDGDEAVALVRRELALHPDARIVVDYGAVMGDAIARHLRDARRRDVVHVTSDGDAATLRWLRTPYLRATRYFSAARTGREATGVVLDAMRENVATVTPFTRLVPQSMRTAADIGQAEPYCDTRFARRAASI